MTEEEVEYKSRRHRQCIEAMQPFTDRLCYYMNLAPAEIKFYPNKENPALSKVERTFDPDWQKLMDKIRSERDEFIKDNFPEFYSENKF